MSDLDLRLAVAKSVAWDAGLLARRRFVERKPGDYKLKGHQDFLTETDGEVEKFVISTLSAAFPGDSFIGEEGGGTAGDGTWIIDPIDGTANFARGIWHFCVSIGFYRDGEPLVGAIVAPMTGELFAAAKGKGATLNGTPIFAAETKAITEVNMELGWNARRPVEEYLSLATRLFTAGANVRRAGSGALGLAYVAAGRSDAYVENHINAWDVAAGIVIAREAGARVSDFFAGEGLTKGNAIVVAAPGIAEDISTITGYKLA